MLAQVTLQKQLFELFGTLLDYPRPGLVQAAQECAALVRRSIPEAWAAVDTFACFAAATPLEKLEETYTATFELGAGLQPYIGYHLFGESYKRSVFLLGLKDALEAHGLDAGAELPDHLVPILRLLAVCEDPELYGDLMHAALVPALDKMIGSEVEDGTADVPYRGLLCSLRTILIGRVVGCST